MSVATLVIDGCPPWDGRYPLEDFSFTMRELHTIKNVSGGLRAGELLDALDNGDSAAFVGVAAVVLARHGKAVDPDDLWDAPFGAIGIELGEAAAGDPLDRSSESGTSESSGSSTDASTTGSDL